MNHDLTTVAGMILAGGLSRRMGGGDKPLITVEGQSLLDRVIDRLSPQVGPMLLNANGDPARFAETTLPVVPDVVEGYGGPLVGILTGLEWLADHSMGVEWMASAAADTPLLPTDLVRRMLDAVRAEGADMAVAASGPQAHPVFGLWPLRLSGELRRAVVESGVRKIDAWTSGYKVARVEWPLTPHDPFFNVNTPEDVVRLELILTGAMPTEPPLTARTTVAVVVERQDSVTGWGTSSWRPLEVLAQWPEGAAPWVLLEKSSGRETYLVTGVPLVLHRSDLASYRYNLATETPRLFVALRPTGEADPPLRVVLATAAPDEAQGTGETEGDMVDGVPLPTVLGDWIIRFTASHPPDEPMRKRKRDTLDAGAAFSRNGRGP